MEKKKPVGPRLYSDLSSSIVVVYCRSNIEAHAGWSLHLCHLSENECSEQVSKIFRKSFRNNLL